MAGSFIREICENQYITGIKQTNTEMEILNFGQVSLISKIQPISIAEELLGMELIPDPERIGGWIENL